MRREDKHILLALVLFIAPFCLIAFNKPCNAQDEIPTLSLSQKRGTQMTIDRVQFSTGAAAGADGSATSTGYSPHVSGKVLAIAIQYNDSPPAGSTDLTLSDEGNPISGHYILKLANAATDAYAMPRHDTVDKDGASLVQDEEAVPVHGRLKATIEGANAGDSCTVTVWLEH